MKRLNKITKEEIKKDIQDIEAEVIKNSKIVEDYAKNLNITITTNSNYDYINAIFKKYPEVNFLNTSLNSYNGYESTVRDIFEVVNNVEYYSLRRIGFDSYNEKKCTIKVLNSDNYYLNGAFESFWGFPDNSFKNIVKTLNNGYSVIELTKENFEKFLSIANFMTDETCEILNYIKAHPEIKENYLKELAINKYINKYSHISHIANLLNANRPQRNKKNYMFVNYKFLLNELESK